MLTSAESTVQLVCTHVWISFDSQNLFQPAHTDISVQGKYVSSWEMCDQKPVWESCNKRDTWAQIKKTHRRWLNNGAWSWSHKHTHPQHTCHTLSFVSHSCYLHGRTFDLTNLPDEVRLNPHSHLDSSRKLFSLSTLLCLSLSLLLLSLCLLSLISLGSSRGSLLGISFFTSPRVWSLTLTLGGSFIRSCLASFNTTELARSASTPRGRLLNRLTHRRPLAKGEVFVQRAWCSKGRLFKGTGILDWRTPQLRPALGNIS